MARGSIKVVLEGRGPLVLKDGDYVATGGEGSIYRANDTVVKLYTDKSKMVRDGMGDKVRVLASRLRHHGIVAPQGVVLNEAATPVGFYMPFAAGEPMARAFVSDFRASTGFSDKDAIKSVELMREIVEFVHSRHALMVDANEMNWLIHLTKLGPVPKVIDVDSWAIDRWPATVIMPSIRDWSTKSFSENTDWFAFGIVAFQLLTGIHPYKGRLDGYKPGELIRRMSEGASVFDPRVKLPHSVRDFSRIPGSLLDWFENTFQRGTRGPPPTALGMPRLPAAAKLVHAKTSPVGTVVFEKLFGYANNPALRVWPCGIALLASGDLISLAARNTIIGKMASKDGEVVHVGDGWLSVGRDAGAVDFDYFDGTSVARIPFSLAAKRLFRAGNRLFAMTDSEMVELQLRLLGKPIITFGARTTIRPNSTAWFDGVAVQDVFGNAFLLLPTETGMVQPRVKELDGAKIVSAKASGRFAAFVVLEKTGDYRKIELAFDRTYTTYGVWSGGTDSPDLNVGILPTGVVATIVNDGEMALFVPANGSVNKIVDSAIRTDMALATWGEKLLYLQNGEVWRISTQGRI